MYPTFLIHSSIKRHQGCFHVLPCPFLRQKLRCRDTVTCPRPQDSGGIQISEQTCLLSCWLTAPLNLLLAICLETAVAHFCLLCCASSPAVLSQAMPCSACLPGSLSIPLPWQRPLPSANQNHICKLLVSQDALEGMIFFFFKE